MTPANLIADLIVTYEALQALEEDGSDDNSPVSRIDAMQDAIAFARTDLKRKSVELARQRNALSLFHSLPTELIVLVFLAVFNHKKPATTDRLQGLAMVSFAWWQIIKNSPVLWTHVDATMENAAEVALHVAKSRKLPLRVTLPWDKFVMKNGPGRPQWLRTLSSQSFRWSELAVICNNYDLSDSSDTDSDGNDGGSSGGSYALPTDKLQNLVSLTATRLLGDRHGTLLSIGILPKLRTLALSGFRPVLETSEWENLTSVTLKRCTLDASELVQCLRASRNLQTLHLHLLWLMSDSSALASNEAGDLSLPHLSSVTISTIHYCRDIYKLVLERLQTRRLPDLKLHCYSDNGTDDTLIKDLLRFLFHVEPPVSQTWKRILSASQRRPFEVKIDLGDSRAGFNLDLKNRRLTIRGNIIRNFMTTLTKPPEFGNCRLEVSKLIIEMPCGAEFPMAVATARYIQSTSVVVLSSTAKNLEGWLAQVSTSSELYSSLVSLRLGYCDDIGKGPSVRLLKLCKRLLDNHGSESAKKPKLCIRWGKRKFNGESGTFEAP